MSRCEYTLYTRPLLNELLSYLRQHTAAHQLLCNSRTTITITFYNVYLILTGPAGSTTLAARVGKSPLIRTFDGHIRGWTLDPIVGARGVFSMASAGARDMGWVDLPGAGLW